MMTAIADVHKAGNTTSYIVCAGKQTSSCKLSAKGSDTKDIKVCALIMCCRSTRTVLVGLSMAWLMLLRVLSSGLG